jgi:hypothetical protein
MKKNTVPTNRAVTHSPTANVKLAALTDAALSRVSGGGGPQRPDLDPNPGNGDPGPSS